ncbi:hypothetical protein BY996DRAFT_1799722 [Phakopsora pachyrhizi]|uniref:NAD(P)-binding protein n=1 Tax=Phakopsora pachyrhizi TaxID=170000 RepID=A0AAV0BPE7_PHAPC|nr:hypothetical protein BY996DRAFT_1799722 [Phakopsora pachyrhizi]CAH7682174.1 hypothetical protein PPACK8108_LOCUS14924 [Phakopsora pachyrhizi]CAH7688532.1 hypothetical protein PPACK8108_LOCUS23498 [Phakopsora pachyrhizi]
MRTNDSNTLEQQLPKASHPPSPTTISINRLEPPTFPYNRLSGLPTLSYAMENMTVSVATLFTSIVDCLMTLYIWIPLGLMRTFTSSVIDPFLQTIGSPDHSPQAHYTRARVVVISGASSGIGAGLVATYANPNTVLILLGRNEGRLNETAKMARSAGCKALETHSIDFAHTDAENSIKKLMQNVHQKYGSIDILLSVAGLSAFTDDDPHGPEQWGANTAKRLNTVNITSTYAFVMSGWEIMKKQKFGRICIISSLLAIDSPPQFAIYAASKANLLSFAQSLRLLSMPYGIQVNCVCPGFITSGLTEDMMAAGSSMPRVMMANTMKMAARIKCAVDEEQPMALWPLNHCLPFVMSSKVNYLNGDLARWMASKMGLTGQMVS